MALNLPGSGIAIIGQRLQTSQDYQLKLEYGHMGKRIELG
jgi:hypothetical protein